MNLGLEHAHHLRAELLAPGCFTELHFGQYIFQLGWVKLIVCITITEIITVNTIELFNSSTACLESYYYILFLSAFVYVMWSTDI